MQPLANEYTDTITLVTRTDERRTVRGIFKPLGGREAIINDRLTIVSRATALVQHSKLTNGLASDWVAIVNGTKWDIESVIRNDDDKTYALTLRGYA